MNMRQVVSLAAVAVCVLAVAETLPPFDWASIEPSRNISWQSCYGDEFQCARLVLPMDWLSVEPELANRTGLRNGTGSEASSNQTVTIAVIKLPAAVPESDASFAGPIFFNPGGPGNSGVEFMHRIGRSLQRVADVPGRRRYEIVSFDPRGVGRSEPRVDCFRGSLLARQAMALETRGTWGLDMGRGALAYSLALAGAYGWRCEDTDKTHGFNVLPFVGTPSVARDVVEMADKIEEERQERLGDAETLGRDIGRQELKKRGATPAKEPVRIKYMGFSYGTLLGNYLASIFPERVGRFILDGVADVLDYATGPGWLGNLVDTDELFHKFLQGCHEAGPKVCALARASDKGWEDLRGRVYGLAEALDAAPQPALLGDGSLVVVSGHDVLMLTGLMLYKPLAYYKSFSRMLDEVVRGNYTLLAERLVKDGHRPALQDTCESPAGLYNSLMLEPASNTSGTTIDAQYAILCGDGDDVLDRNVTWWADYVTREVSSSRVLGAHWSTVRFACSGWRPRSRWTFKGPFKTPAPGSGPTAPAAPVLFLSSRLDPVTPLANARAMAAQHPGSRVVVQESMGHCALLAAPSRCTRDLVARYLDDGSVPEDEVSCAADCGPWDEHCDVDDFDEEGGDALSALWKGHGPGLRLSSHPLGVV